MSKTRPSNTLALAAAVAGCVCLGACSTIVKGSGQQIAVSTSDAHDATCRLKGGDGVDVSVSTPGTVRVPKSKKDIAVACEAPGRAPASQVLKSTYSNYSIVEAPLGYPVDAISGAMWVYPETVDVRFGGQPGPAPAQRAGG